LLYGIISGLLTFLDYRIHIRPDQIKARKKSGIQAAFKPFLFISRYD